MIFVPVCVERGFDRGAGAGKSKKTQASDGEEA